MTSDEESYSRFLSGDPSAYDELLLRHGDGLVRFLNGYVHDLQDAEDLMIEAFARIMVKRPAIRPGCFKAYLYRTARNLATRFHGVKIRVPLFSLDELKGELADKKRLEDELQTRELSGTLQACLGRVDPKLREALWLVYGEGMSYAQAALVMGVSVKRIDHLLQRGKQVLRQELEKEGVTHAHG